jgi:DNA-binding transcriptional ArsR family regulator
MNINISEKPDDETLTKIFHALSDPIRIEVLRLLVSRGTDEYNCTVLGENLDMIQLTLSYHVKTLHEAGLINARKVSREKIVSLNQKTFDPYLPHFLDLLQSC